MGLLSPTAKQCALYLLSGRQRPLLEQESTSVAALYDQQRKDVALSNPWIGVAGHHQRDRANEKAARVGSLKVIRASVTRRESFSIWRRACSTFRTLHNRSAGLWN